jgi:GH43 family beta-xylosidase
MKRIKLFITTLLCLVATSSMADKVIVNAPEITPGENVKISVGLENTNEVAACQLSLYLPNGITLAKNSKNRFIFALSERSDDHVMTITEAENGSFLIAIYSPSNAPLFDNAGELFTVELKVDGGVTEDKQASFKGIVISTPDEVGTDLNDVTFDLKIKEETVTIKASDLTMVYGAAVPELTYTSEGAELKGTPELTCEASATSSVGTYPIVVTQGTVTNSKVTYVNGKLTITKAPLTITAKSYTIKQGDALPTFEAEYSGFKNNETSAVLTTQPTITTTATSASAPGTYEITISGASATNYDITYVKGTLTITQADEIVVTAKSYSRKYGEANPTFEYTASSAALSGTPSINCSATETSPVGEYDIVVSKGSITNYNVTLVNGKLTITKAPLTITAKNYTIKQGDALPTFEAEYSGFKNNETSSVLTTQPTITTTATSASAPGTYEITISGASATNYDITYVKGTLIIQENPTSIENVTVSHPADVYTLQGQKVRTQATTLKGLPTGIYIVNGKKVRIIRGY